MSLSLDQYVQSIEGESVQEADRKKSTPHPAGWEPGVAWDGSQGTLTTRATMDQHPEWDELLTSWGFDPKEYAIVEPVAFRTWEAQTPEGIQQLWSWRAGIRRRVAVDSRIDYEDLIREIKGFKPSKTSPPCGEQAFVVALADWQMGKADFDGTEGIVRRIQEAIPAVQRRYRELRKIGRKLGQLYVVGMGDIIENCDGQYPQQTYTVELNRRDQVKVSRRLVRDAVKTWSPDFEKVIVSAVPGNHGENRKDGRSYTDDADNDDVALFESVAEILSENRAFDHVKFFIPKDEVSVVFDIAGTVVAFTHAHKAERSAGVGLPQAKVKTWWANQSFGECPVGDANVLVSAHFHHFSMIDFGPKLHIQAPTLDGGSKYWQDATGSRSKPGTLTLVVGENGVQDVEVVR